MIDLCSYITHCNARYHVLNKLKINISFIIKLITHHNHFIISWALPILCSMILAPTLSINQLYSSLDSHFVVFYHPRFFVSLLLEFAFSLRITLTVFCSISTFLW